MRCVITTSVFTLTCAAVFAQTPPAAAVKPTAAAPPPLTQQWTNPSDTTLDVEVTAPPRAPVFLELGKDGKPQRVLKAEKVATGYHLNLPGKATVQMWARADLATQKDSPFAEAARLGAFPYPLLGPYTEVPGATMDAPRPEIMPWQIAPASFRAFPEGDVPVMVRILNQGFEGWKDPRVHLFMPETWKSIPQVAEFVGVDGGPLKHGLPPGSTGIATFIIHIPKSATLDQPTPLVAFLRFQAGGKTVTVQNSVDVTVEAPIARSYGMNEKGTRFAVHLTNRFAPVTIGSPVVEIRNPAGSDWSIVLPTTETLSDSRDSVANITMKSLGPDPVAVPVVVTLNGFRMGETPVVEASASFSAAAPPESHGLIENGLTVVPAGSSPYSVVADGTTFAQAGDTNHRLAFKAPDKFAVSDPAEWVSPSWVTVSLAGKSPGHVRLEYDAFGSDQPVVAADFPLSAGTEKNLSFILPDAKFAGGLDGHADFRLIITGEAAIHKVTLSKWNPLTAAPQKTT